MNKIRKYTVTDEVKNRADGQRKTERNNDIIRMYNEGLPMRQIARDLNISVARVSAIYKKYA